MLKYLSCACKIVQTIKSSSVYYKFISNSSPLPGYEKLSGPNSLLFDLGFLISNILLFIKQKYFIVCTEIVYYLVCVVVGQ